MVQLMFPARAQSAEVVQPGKETFDFPAAAVASQFATALCVFRERLLWCAEIRWMRCFSRRRDRAGHCRRPGHRSFARAWSDRLPTTVYSSRANRHAEREDGLLLS